MMIKLGIMADGLGLRLLEIILLAGSFLLASDYVMTEGKL